jgi:hypothetical protein
VPHPLEREWAIDADTILSAIMRSSDLTKRGVRGIIAEAIFVDEVAPQASAEGWKLEEAVVGKEQGEDRPYDALLRKGQFSVRIQVKLQRLEKKIPKLYYPKHYEAGSLYVVEVQKTRSGEQQTKQTISANGDVTVTDVAVTEDTRPYRFTDFDVLAVNMHPSTGNWKNFRYTVASWLLPRSGQANLIEIFQPVAAKPSELWTDDLLTCLQWFESGIERRVLAELLHPVVVRTKKSLPKKKRSLGGSRKPKQS